MEYGEERVNDNVKGHFRKSPSLATLGRRTSD
jgi:hypothetical protein